MLTYRILLKRSWNVLFNGKNFETLPETNPDTWYVNEKSFLLVECYISFERCWEMSFNGKNFENVNWNF